MANQVLFLTLRVFSATGGLEKVCKVVCKALDELNTEGLMGNIKTLSMYDGRHDADNRYIPADKFRGYGKKKFAFTFDSIFNGLRSDIVVISHINLISIAYIIKLLRPKTKIVLFAHGIEIWGPLSGWRKKMLHKCDLIMPVSKFTKNKMQEQYNLPETKFNVLNNCIDPYLEKVNGKGKNASLQKVYGFTSDNIVLLTLTRLSSKELYKGYDHVLISISNLKDTFPQLKYLVVGRYDDIEKQRLDTIIEQYSLQQYVVFTGYVPDEQLEDHYKLADIYVMPSKKEGFGIVFIEAMNYGLPVIAGNKDGSADALCDGKLGILVNPDDQMEIDQAIEKIIRDREKYLPNREYLMECFSYDTYKNRLQKILNSLTTVLFFLNLYLQFELPVTAAGKQALSLL
ncbi:MAG: glycosyltransferase family 4 protein [Chitinophagaceae bacterium]|nr:glycosyltransferase family 4 protein [Chitinophagaceae bacterium]